MAATERLRRLALVVSIASLAAGARADGRVALGGHYYLDNDRLEVWHPHATLRIDATDELTLRAAYDADVVSAATIDVRTSASTRAFTENRHGIGGDALYAPSATLRLGLGASGSFSPDYESGTSGLSLAIEDDARIHTFSAALTGSYASVGRTGDQRRTGELLAAGLSLGWGVVLSPEMVLDVSAGGEVQSGYLESPYRMVSVYDAGDPTARVALPEAAPDLRLRGALRARLRIAPEDFVFVRGSYRAHADDWGVLGHTVEAELTLVPIRELTVTASFRFLGQRAASFYRGRYESLPLVPELRTRDRELAGQSQIGGGLLVELLLPPVLDGDLGVFLRGEITHARLYDTPLLPERLSGLVGLGLSFRR